MAVKAKKTENQVLKSKRFVVRKSLVGKGQLIEFINKKGVTIKYNHDVVFHYQHITSYYYSLILYFGNTLLSHCTINIIV